MPERRWVVSSALLLAASILGWWLLFRTLTAPERPAPASVAPQAPVSFANPAPPPQPPLQSQPETVAVDFVDGAPVRPAGSAEVDAEGMLPHPITPQHERIFHENNLIGDLNGAMDAKDAEGLRRLLQQYRDEYPEDSHVLQQGYAIIADCLERPGAETRAVAQRYYDEELDSGLRRYIRRSCLE
jgi:hypothetical protein